MFEKEYLIPSSLRSHLIFSIGFGTLILLLLFVFRPFGLNGVTGTYRVFLSCAGYGAIGAITWITFLRILAVFAIDTLKTWQFLVLILGVQLVAGVVSAVYHNLIFDGPSFRTVLPWMLSSVLLTGIFPTMVIFLLLETSYFDTPAADLSKKSPNATVMQFHTVKEGEDHYNILHNRIVHVKAEGNYVSIFHIVDDGSIERSVVRDTLENVEGSLAENPSFVRCHRSHLVNIDMVKGIIGNSLNKKLVMRPSEIMDVPISRTMVSFLLGILNKSS